MPGTGRWRAFGVTVSVLLAGAGVTVAATERPAFVIHLDDRADVPPGDLARARVVVERVFREAGVAIVWADGVLPASVSELNAAAGHSRHVAVMLVNISKGERTREATGCVLGLALPARATAYVFYSRIVNTSNTRPVDADVVLGRVIAHEVAHLLLRPARHSNYGIMRPDLDLGFTNPNRFTDDEARRIRARLVDSTANE